MSIVAPPALPLSTFTLAFVSPPGARLVSPYTGRSVIVGKGGGYWTGTVGWNTAAWDGEDQDNRERLLLGFAGMLNGVNNRVAIPLPDMYQPKLEDGVTASMSSLANTDQGLRAGISLSDGTALAAGSYVNVGTRLYVVRRSVVGTAWLYPDVRPLGGGGLSVRNVVVNAEIAPPHGVGRHDLTGLVEHIFNWREDI